MKESPLRGNGRVQRTKRKTLSPAILRKRRRSTTGTNTAPLDRSESTGRRSSISDQHDQTVKYLSNKAEGHDDHKEIDSIDNTQPCSDAGVFGDEAASTHNDYAEIHANREEQRNCLIQKEIEYPPARNYLNIQPDLSAYMRSVLLDWMTEVCEAYALRRETLHLAIFYVDCFLSRVRKQHSHLDWSYESN